MSTIETLQNTIISHLNTRRFAEAERQLLVLCDQFGNSNSVSAATLAKIAKQSRISSTKKLALFEEVY